MSNASEIGVRLQALGMQTSEQVLGTKGVAVEHLAEVLGVLVQAKAAAEDPIEQVVQMLGENHNGTNGIIGNTVPVVDVIEKAMEMVQASINELEGIGAPVDNLAFVYGNIGDQIGRAGG